MQKLWNVHAAKPESLLQEPSRNDYVAPPAAKDLGVEHHSGVCWLGIMHQAVG
jgi:hypothetical protein